jgi:hypothetical protein
MSFGIALKVAEGMVLTADSRVTLTAAVPVPQPRRRPQLMALPSTYDTATKLLLIKEQKYHEAALLPNLPFRSSMLRGRGTLSHGTASPAGKA